MAIISVAQESARRIDFGENMARKYEQPYIIISNIFNESEVVIRNAPGLPVLFTPLPSDPGCLFTSCTLDQEKDAPQVWRVTCIYSSLSLTSRSANTARSDPAQRSENPLQRPSRLSFGSERFQRAISKDINGVAIKNSAKDPFDPPVVVDDFRGVITIRKNVANFDLNQWLKYTNCVNSSTFLGFAAGVCKIAEISGESQFENGIYFFERTVSIHTANKVGTDRDWKVRPLDIGFQYLDGGVSKPIPMQGGLSPSTPQRLDGNGGILGPTDADVFAGPFEVYDEVDFGELNLL